MLERESGPMHSGCVHLAMAAVNTPQMGLYGSSTCETELLSLSGLLCWTNK